MAGFNPSNTTHLSRLKKAREDAYKKLAPFRSERFNGLRELVGKCYGHEGTERINPVNLVLLTVQSYCQTLVSKSPEFDVNTKWKGLTPYVNLFKLGLADAIEEMNLRRKIGRAHV